MTFIIKVTISTCSTNQPHTVDFQHHTCLKWAATPQAPGTHSDGHSPMHLHPGYNVLAIFIKMLQAHLAICIMLEVQLTHSRQHSSLLAWLIVQTHGLQLMIDEAQ